MQPFHLESITAGGDCAVLRIEGEIDAYAALQLREQVIGLACNGTVHLIADMRGAGFLDSAGVGALVGGLKGLRTRGGSLALVASTGSAGGVPENLGPGRQIVSRDSPNGVSRIGGQAGTQAPDHTPVPSQNRASRAGSTIHTLPAEYEQLAAACTGWPAGCRTSGYGPFRLQPRPMALIFFRSAISGLCTSSRCRS